MKNIFLILTMAVLFAACKETVKGTNGVIYKTPIEYNDYIVSRQTTLMKNIVSFGEMAQTNPDSAGKMLDLFAKETTDFIQEIKGMPPYKGDTSLRNAGVNIFTFYKKVFQSYYKQIMEINKSGENKTEEGVAKLNSIVTNLNKEEEIADKAFHKAQKDFAETNKMKLIENSMQKKLDEMNK